MTSRSGRWGDRQCCSRGGETHGRQGETADRGHGARGTPSPTPRPSRAWRARPRVKPTLALHCPTHRGALARARAPTRHSLAIPSTRRSRLTGPLRALVVVWGQNRCLRPEAQRFSNSICMSCPFLPSLRCARAQQTAQCLWFLRVHSIAGCGELPRCPFMSMFQSAPASSSMAVRRPCFLSSTSPGMPSLLPE